MTKEKCREILSEELGKINGKNLYNPEDWKKLKPLMVAFIKNVDEVVEVFNKENEIKGVPNGR